MGDAVNLPTELAPLWRSVHDRLSSGRPVSRVRVGPLDPAQRSALADLLGQDRLPGEHATVPLPLLDQVLTDSVGLTAREVVEQLLGPVGDRAGERARAEAAKSGLWAWLAAHPVVAAQPALAGWADSLRRAGLPDGSVITARDLLAKVLSVLAELPAPGIPLPVLADGLLDDPHGLDDGTRCATLVQRALAAIYDVAAPENAQQRRALWDLAGVADDHLSSVVLAAGLRPTGDDLASQLLRICAEAGHAAVLTLGHLRASDLADGLPGQVWVFENPSILALALARFGRRCPPIVVTSGWPNSAVVALLGKLAAAGATLRYHGDFDGEGLRIAAAVAARSGAIPWRMTSADYLAAVSDGPGVGRVTQAPWDAELAGHLTRLNRTVSEEREAEKLLADLAAHLG